MTTWNLWAVDDAAPTFYDKVRLIRQGLTERAAIKRASKHNDALTRSKYTARYLALPDGEEPEGAEASRRQRPEAPVQGYSGRVDR